MKKHIYYIITFIIIFVALTITVFATSININKTENDNTISTTTISEDYIPSETTTLVEETTVVEVTTEQATKREEPATKPQTTITENHPVKNNQQYPIATQVWNYMKTEFGWNDIVCAGIMGNLMAECGGCWTQDLNYKINTKHGMGMIQWTGSRRTQLIAKYGNNPTVEEQLEFMKDELYGTNGVTQQVSQKQLKLIMEAETPEDCAFYFASYYERCAQQYRARRKGYARTAYEYFVG